MIEITKRKENTLLERNVTIDYLYCFLNCFDLSSAIWVLYLVYRGLPLWQIGIVEGVFHMTSLLFEVPSGMAADLLGRKRVMILGRICQVISAFFILYSTELVGLCFAFSISALGYNLNSGSEEALVYDSLKYCGKEKKYLKVNSKRNLIIEISQALSTFIGGMIAQYSYVACYSIVIIVGVITIIPCIMFCEPEYESEQKEKNVGIVTHCKNCVSILRGNPAVVRILLFYPIVFSFQAVVFFYGQQFFSTKGCNQMEISLIMLVAGVGSCLGAITCNYVMNWFGKQTKYVISAMMGISIICISRFHLLAAIVAFAIMNYANGLLYPIQSLSLNEVIPSEQRATIISIDSMMFSIAMIVMFPVSGWIADQTSLSYVFLGLGMIQLVMILLLMNQKRSRDKEPN